MVSVRNPLLIICICQILFGLQVVRAEPPMTKLFFVQDAMYHNYCKVPAFTGCAKLESLICENLMSHCLLLVPEVIPFDKVDKYYSDVESCFISGAKMREEEYPVCQEAYFSALASGESDGFSETIENPDNSIPLAEMAEKVVLQAPVAPNNLPYAVYPNSSLVISNEGSKGISLPSVVYQTPDTVKAVIDFYRQQLPGFTYKQLDGYEYLFIKGNISDDFTTAKDVIMYIKTPHVHIKEIEADFKSGKPATNITMFFKAD